MENIIRRSSSSFSQVAVLLQKDAIFAIVSPVHSDMDLDVIRNEVRRTMPSYSLPAQYHTISTLPLTTNQRVNYQDLGRIIIKRRTELDCKSANVNSGVIHEIAKLWPEILQFPLKIQLGDNFSHLGGHSILQLRLVQRPSERFVSPMTPKFLAQNPTLSGQVQIVQESMTTMHDTGIGRQSLYRF